jgi:hypothetical protein
LANAGWEYIGLESFDTFPPDSILTGGTLAINLSPILFEFENVIIIVGAMVLCLPLSRMAKNMWKF